MSVTKKYPSGLIAIDVGLWKLIKANALPSRFVSSNIMMGQIPTCGTGMSDVLIDESKILDINPEKEYELEDIEEWGELDYCDENVNMEFDIDNINAENIDIDDLNITNMIKPITPPGTPPGTPPDSPVI